MYEPGLSDHARRATLQYGRRTRESLPALFPIAMPFYGGGQLWFRLVCIVERLGEGLPIARTEGDHFVFCKNLPGALLSRSAMTLLEKRDGEPGGSYLDLVEFIEDRGAQHHIAVDLEQLFRRVVFNVLIGNRDDHLRNHGFIREITGWRLAPAYDMNPNPSKASHALTLDGHNAEPSLKAAVGCADMYRLSAARAKTIVDEVFDVLKGGREVAEQHHLSRLEIHIAANDGGQPDRHRVAELAHALRP